MLASDGHVPAFILCLFWGIPLMAKKAEGNEIEGEFSVPPPQAEAS